MSSLHPVLSTRNWRMVLALLTILGVGVAFQNGAQNVAVAARSVDVLQVTATPTTVIETPAAVATPTIAASVPLSTAMPITVTEVPTGTVTPTVVAEVPIVTATPRVVAWNASMFEISLAELGYGERTLTSPYGVAEYTLRLPDGWELRTGFLDLDLSYTYNSVTFAGTEALPSFFGDIIVVIDGQTQFVFPIEEAVLEHLHLRVDLPVSLLNDPARSTHSVAVFLDAGHICEVPHRASLNIHPASSFFLDYEQLPIAADLALYPYPFYQRAFEPDWVRFVLPAQPAEVELTAAVAVAAKLGDLASRMVISGTTDLTLMDRLGALKEDESFHEHLIVIGRPESNEIIIELDQLGVLPVSLRERQLSLASEGPAIAGPGEILTYTLTLTNTTDRALSSLSLMDTLPAYAHVVSCTPLCTEGVGGVIRWDISSLEPGETRSHMLELRLSEAITDSVIENTAALLDATSGPLNVTTLTATVRSTPLPESGTRLSASDGSRYLFVLGERAVPENDGIVQEIASPWDQTRAILILTGLSDEAVYKASQAMSFESQFPGMQGSFALVREVRSLEQLPSRPLTTTLTFADLGYGDRALSGASEEADYSLDIPFSWRLTERAYLDLRFSHSQLLDYGRSFMTVSFNSRPIATIALSNETALGGELKVGLPPSQMRPGQENQISVQVSTRSVDECTSLDVWLVISDASRLYLDHIEQDIGSFDLGSYPYPFNGRFDLSDVLFVLPPEPRLEEWEETLQLAVALGGDAGGSNLAPAVVLGDTWSEAEWVDYHLIVIGRPSRNPVLQRVNVQLPQPFRLASDQIEQRLDEVVFRLPPDLSLGLVQLISAPWNQARAFLAITGTTDEGVKWAMDALADQPWVLKGNLAFVRGDVVNRIDTRQLTRGGVAKAVATAVPEMTPAATARATVISPPPTPTSGLSRAETISGTGGRPAWLIPLIGINGGIVLGILAFVIWRARHSRQ